jgi:phytoene synthase
MASLNESYAHCRRVARTRAKNFYYSFLLLPREHRDAMCAVYAFMRFCDDLSDEPGASREPLERWRRALDAAMDGRYGDDPALPAFHDTVRRFRIPPGYFHEMIDGVTADLEPRRLQTFDELYRYCYQVASVVGLTTVHIFEYTDPAALPLAEKCGVAFQLTNIIRDVKEDAERGRVYLPADDLARFGLSADDVLRAGDLTDLLRFEGSRARDYYDASAPLVEMVAPRCRPSLWALITIYRKLLEKIESRDYAVMSQRIALSAAEKSWVVVRAAARSMIA